SAPGHGRAAEPGSGQSGWPYAAGASWRVRCLAAPRRRGAASAQTGRHEPPAGAGTAMREEEAPGLILPNCSSLALIDQEKQPNVSKNAASAAPAENLLLEYAPTLCLPFSGETCHDLRCDRQLHQVQVHRLR